jgi:hypothetical protein
MCFTIFPVIVKMLSPVIFRVGREAKKITHAIYLSSCRASCGLPGFEGEN